MLLPRQDVVRQYRTLCDRLRRSGLYSDLANKPRCQVAPYSLRGGPASQMCLLATQRRHRIGLGGAPGRYGTRDHGHEAEQKHSRHKDERIARIAFLGGVFALDDLAFGWHGDAQNRRELWPPEFAHETVFP